MVPPVVVSEAAKYSARAQRAASSAASMWGISISKHHVAGLIPLPQGRDRGWGQDPFPCGRRPGPGGT